MDSLDSLDKSLDNLEEALAPLLDNSLSETLQQLGLLQQAKLQILLPFVVNDLVFVYLRTRGIGPKTHAVHGELDRVKQYFDKIKKAEDPEKRKFAVDQGAATRFIKHAIKQSQATQDQARRELKGSTHTRFTEAETVAIPSASAAALAKIQARGAAAGRDESASEESELEVFNEPSDGKFQEELFAKGREDAGTGPLAPPMTKKRRRAMDPWSGYDESREATPVGARSEQQKRKKSKAVNIPSVHKNGATPSANVRNVEMHVDAEEAEEVNPIATHSMTSRTTSEKDIGTGIIDVDALSSESIGDQDSQPKSASDVIDVDAMDSSRTGTPTQGKKKKKKKKKTNT